MSRGNINRKYLRRRKNWFQRNWGWLVLIFVIVAAIAVGVIFGINHFGNKQNSNQQSNNQTQQATVNVNWIEDKEPELTAVQKKADSYKIPEGVEFPYYIKVNRAMGCTTVYGIDANGEYTIPVKAFACSVGKPGEETIVGENFTTTNKYDWRLMVDNTYGQYAFRIDGSYLFHSVPYTSQKKDTLETDQYNLLGQPASLGCVRMCVADVKWIYDNCVSGTKVTIYDDATTPGPLGKPETIKIPVDSPNAGWDPTDPDAANPWKTYKAAITGAKDITTKVGTKVDLKNGIKATDTCGNDITSKIITIGKYTFDQEGVYKITYKVTDAIGSVAQVTVNLNVTK